MKYIATIFLTGLIFIAHPAWAIDLQTAKAKGMVGELHTGYLGAVNTPSADVKALIDDVNAKRKQKYQEIATRNKTSLQAVEQLAGKKAIEKSQSGSYINLGSGWITK